MNEAQSAPAPVCECAIPSAPILLTVDETAARAGPAFPAATLRDLIYHSEPRLTAAGDKKPPNGFADCVVRINGRVLVDWGRFLLFIESNRGRVAHRRRTRGGA